MRKQVVSGIIFSLLHVVAGFCVPVTQIDYDVAEFSPGRWEYTYEVSNIGLPVPVQEFTIWFDFGFCDNLAIETSDPLAGDWDEIVWQPEPVLRDDGAYDARALDSGIARGQTVAGFAVSFDWLGIGEPGAQFYEIVDPMTFETIDSGWTIPEPGTLLLFALGGLHLLHRKGGRYNMH